MVRDPLHIYLDRLPPPASSASIFAGALNHRQVTDVCLLAVARRHPTPFLTFDSRLREFENVEIVP
jgi:predicted nucleic acid-binding protein